MVDQITFRGDDNLRWGLGQGSDLSASQIDINFWVLLTAVQALQAQANDHASIDHFVIAGQNLFVHLTNHMVLGPYVLPVAQWNFTGPWINRFGYHAFDVFTQGGAVYLVLVDHVSNSLFSSGASDGLGHNFYGLLLAAPPKELPQTGEKGAFLQWQNSPADVRWFLPTRNIAIFLEGAPDASSFSAEYEFTEITNFPVGLTLSQFSVGTRPTIPQEFDLYQDGGPVGSITFNPSGPVTVVFNHAIRFTPGEILTILSPSVPDPHMTRIRFNFVGTLD